MLSVATVRGVVAGWMAGLIKEACGRIALRDGVHA